MYKILFIAGIFMLFLSQLAAQNIQTGSVYLKNGWTLNGSIVRDTNKNVIIETCCNNIFRFPDTMVEKIIYHEPIKKQEMTVNGKWHNYTVFSMYTGGGYGNAASTGLQSILGFDFNNHFALGVGTGFEKFEFNLVPVFGNVKITALNSNFSPIVNVSAGYALAVGKANVPDAYYYNNSNIKIFGGPVFGAELGIQKKFNTGSAVIVAFGYRYQKAKQTEEYIYNAGNITTTNYLYNRMAFRFGFIFR